MVSFLKYKLEPQEKELLETFNQRYEEYLAQGARLEQMTRAPIRKTAKAINDLVDLNVKTAACKWLRQQVKSIPLRNR